MMKTININIHPYLEKNCLNTFFMLKVINYCILTSEMQIFFLFDVQYLKKGT